MKTPRNLAALALFAAAGLAQQAPPEDHPVALDRTGITWAIPFEAALERARAENRLLAIKPVAFGTTRDGCW